MTLNDLFLTVSFLILTCYVVTFLLAYFVASRLGEKLKTRNKIWAVVATGIIFLTIYLPPAIYFPGLSSRFISGYFDYGVVWAEFFAFLGAAQVGICLGIAGLCWACVRVAKRHTRSKNLAN